AFDRPAAAALAAERERHLGLDLAVGRAPARVLAGDAVDLPPAGVRVEAPGESHVPGSLVRLGLGGLGREVPLAEVGLQRPVVVAADPGDDMVVAVLVQARAR